MNNKYGEDNYVKSFNKTNHTNDKNISDEENKCIYCEKKFSSKSYLKTHLNTSCKAFEEIDESFDISIDEFIDIVVKVFGDQDEKKNEDAKQEKHSSTDKIMISNKKEEKKVKYIKKKIPIAMRIAVWDKYIGLGNGKAKCLCCEEMEIFQFNFDCGHIIAESKGGETSIDNMIPICSFCNRSMFTTNFYVFKEELKKFKKMV